MKTKKTNLLAGLVLLTHTTANADIPAGLVGYTHYVELAPSDNTGESIIGTVGSWSWNDRDLGDGVLWRHQSDWIAINLTEPANLLIQVERNNDESDSSKLFPSFTLYSSFNDTAEGSHFADNTSDLQWAVSSQELSYITHHDNSTTGAIGETISLQAGEYTLLLGGNAQAESEAVNVNYTTNLSVTPIPEASTSLLGLLGGVLLLGHRKR